MQDLDSLHVNDLENRLFGWKQEANWNGRDAGPAHGVLSTWPHQFYPSQDMRIIELATTG
jgi:hypothetical protein